MINEACKPLPTVQSGNQWKSCGCNALMMKHGCKCLTPSRSCAPAWTSPLAPTCQCVTRTPCGERRRAAITSPTPSSSSAAANGAQMPPSSGPTTALSSARRSKFSRLDKKCVFMEIRGMGRPKKVLLWYDIIAIFYSEIGWPSQIDLATNHTRSTRWRKLPYKTKHFLLVLPTPTNFRDHLLDLLQINYCEWFSPEGYESSKSTNI